jgi:hypothetical protein
MMGYVGRKVLGVPSAVIICVSWVVNPDVSTNELRSILHLSPRSIRLRFALFFCVIAFDLSATLLRAFLIPIHSNVTNNALDRFPEIAQWEKQQMVRGCAAADMLEGGLPFFGGPYEKRFHFDNNFSFQQVAANYADVADLVDRNLAKPKKDPWEFGKAMHAIEDLYSHSNYVELYRDFMFANGKPLVGSSPTFEEVLLQPDDYKDFLSILKGKLRTGRYPTPIYHMVAYDTDHGKPLPYFPGMNKDVVGRDLYEDARQTALSAVSWYLTLYLKDPDTLSQWKRLESIRFGVAPVKPQAARTSAGAPAPISFGTGPSRPNAPQARATSHISSKRLVSNLSSKSSKTRKAAIEALANRGDPAPATAIAPLIQDPDQDVAATACWALGALRNSDTSSLAVLALQKNALPVSVRAACAIAVGRIGEPQTVAALNTAASNEKEETDVRLASIQALAMFNAEQATSLVPLLQSSDPRIKASAAYSASQIQIPTAVEPIKSMLSSPDAETKRYALDAAGIWPQRFSEQLTRIAADSHESPENRILSLTSISALPEAEKNADFVKTVSELVKPEQPREVQAAAVQVLSEQPEARPVLERIAKDEHQSPDVRKKLSEIVVETGTPVSASSRVSISHDYSWYLGGLFVVLAVGLVLLIRDRFNQEKGARVRKKILLEMLQDKEYKGWRRLDTLMQVIGADRETTTRLLIEIGARGSQEKGSDLWGLREQHPLGEKKDAQI